ncbi:TPA: coiled-coil domain-containing protein [Salmonella enterica]
MVDIPKMSETIDKALDAVKSVTTEPVVKAVNQRLSNPFFLCFISSWVLCNWDRVLLLLFSFSLDIEQRIEKIKALPSNSVFFGIGIPHTHTFWYPFVASIIFVVGTPFISYVVDVIQNGVLTKKSTNDSKRKQSALDLKIEEINKNVEYEYADAKARLNAEKANKAIEYDTSALEEKYNSAQVKLRDINVLIKEKEIEAQAVASSYHSAMNSMSKIRKELDSKENELMDLNAKIIANQNKLDSINQGISKNTLPFARPTLGSNGFQGLGLSSANSTLSGKNLAKLNWGQGINWPNLNSASLQTVSDIASGLNSVSHNSNDEKNNK